MSGNGGLLIGARALAWRPASFVLPMLALLSACGDDTAPTPTPGTIIEGNAVQIFLREAFKIGWFGAEDPVEVDSDALTYEEALARATVLDLSLYPTVPGTPPYANGLPGWLIIAQGDFYDISGGATPTPDTPRRPAVAAAFVDTQGRLTYSMRFTDVTPSPETPREALPAESPSQ